jgi:hypothetical protein
VLKLTVVLQEGVDEDNNFVIIEGFELELEHSLVSLSKWEAKFGKPFLSKNKKTDEEALWYIQAMCLTPNVPPEVFQKLSNANVEAVNEYLNTKQTATWFPDTPDGKNQEIITNEVIYYWLTSFRIPWEAQYWNLNRLFTLIRVFDAKNSPVKKKVGTDDLARRREENRRRLEQHHTNG